MNLLRQYNYIGNQLFVNKIVDSFNECVDNVVKEVYILINAI